MKLKGDVLRGEEEVEVILTLHHRFSHESSRSTPTTAGVLKDAIRLPRDQHGLWPMPKIHVTPKAFSSGREAMVEFWRATGLPTATHGVASEWREMSTASRCSR